MSGLLPDSEPPIPCIRVTLWERWRRRDVGLVFQAPQEFRTFLATFHRTSRYRSHADLKRQTSAVRDAGVAMSDTDPRHRAHRRPTALLAGTAVVIAAAAGAGAGGVALSRIGRTASSTASAPVPSTPVSTGTSTGSGTSNTSGTSGTSGG